MTGSPPFLWAAVAFWAASSVCLVSGIAVVLRRRRRRADAADATAMGRLPLFLISLAVFGGAAGAGAFYAGPGQTGSPVPDIVQPQFEVSPAATPLVMPEQPPATDSAQPGAATPSPRVSSAATRPAGPFKVGFDSVGDVEIGAPEESISKVFGEPTGIRPDDSLGKTAKAYVYEDGGMSLTIYTLEGKVFFYSAGSSNFVSFSGVRVGDSIDKLREAYGSKLEERDGQYFLGDTKGRVVVFRMDGGKIARIEGGQPLD